LPHISAGGQNACFTGSVDVTLHYGSGADAATIEENFPFTCTTAASTAEPLKPLSEHTEMKVDTSSWHGEVDEGDGAEARD
jgi:hypothetical protein